MDKAFTGGNVDLPSLMTGPNPLAPVVVLLLIGLLPILAMSVTSYVKLSVVLSIFRSALGVGQVPSGSLVATISLVLTAYIMSPVVTDVYEEMQQNKDAGTTQEVGSGSVSIEKISKAITPLESFLKRESRLRERAFFALYRSSAKDGQPVEMVSDEDLSQSPLNEKVRCKDGRKDCSIDGENLLTLTPAFLLTELREAFVMGFCVYLPFLAVDLIVAHVLLGLGMMMVNPTLVSLPVKLVLFCICDGWFLMARGLMLGYATR